MSTPQRFRKRPVEVEAKQWDGTAEGSTPIIDWILANDGTAKFFCSHDMGCPGTTEGHVISIRTREGSMHASPGDWCVREPFPADDRRFYPCKPDIFARTYEAVDA